MNLTVAPYGWDTALPVDVQVLLEDTASHLNRLMRDPFVGTVVVVPAPCDDFNPMTHYRPSPNDPFFIQLTARDKKWAQFAYQFSHEICHVLSGYERMRGSRNSWFHEVLCELASAFTLRRMAEGWPSSPPYPNWANYAVELSTYADKYLSREERRLPTSMTLSAWLLSEEDSLRQDCCQRDKNAVVAYSLLPIFETEPVGWNAIRRLPDSSAMFQDYLLEWHRQVEPADKPFVTLVQSAFQERASIKDFNGCAHRRTSATADKDADADTHGGN